MFDQILVVCVGNICRSPMAEAMLQVAFQHKKVASAGIGAMVGEPADRHARRLLEERGLDLSGHRARQLNQRLVREHELVLVMEDSQQEWIETQWPQARGRVYRWGHWSNFEVPDPYQLDEQAFRDVLALLERGLEDWKEKL